MCFNFRNVPGIIYLSGALLISTLYSATVSSDDDHIAQHRVQHGETLSELALEYYRDAHQWHRIHEANQAVIADPNQLAAGVRLDIPAREEDIARESITLASSYAYYPFADPDLPGGGMAVTIAVEVLETAGYDVSLEYLDSWPEVEEAVAETTYDLAVPYAHTTQRELQFTFSNGLYDMYTQFFVSEDSDLSGDWRRAEVDGKIVCKPHGFQDADIENQLKDGTFALRYAESTVECFDYLNSGKADLFPINANIGWHTLAETPELDPSDYAMIQQTAGKAPLRAMISDDHPHRDEIIEDFNEALAYLEGEGTISRIQNEAIDRFESTHLEGVEQNIREPEGIDREGDSVILYTSGDYEPYTDEELLEEGLSTEIVRRAVALGLDREAEIVFKDSWSEAEEGVRQGEALATFPYVYEQSRDAEFGGDFQFSRNYLNNFEVDIFVPEDSPIESYSGRADLDGLTTCKPEGYYTTELEDHIENGLIRLLQEGQTIDSCFEKLGESIDFISMNRYVAQAAISQNPDVDNDEVRSIGSHANLALQVMAQDSSEGQEILDAIDEGLGKLRRRGEIREIEERHQQAYEQRRREDRSEEAESGHIDSAAEDAFERMDERLDNQ
ncbi:transporter substrate-binding domain-containing protein [Halorhodospira halochloris]|uniref:transporter substrate-binding domain-containing protein n=1 Tax=Halorhodospira halochloris TaxID=1052 RepID=UPI001EE9A3A5|nr:transporter substrate-binding domain-containing protein [Halorhodospira halochloris]MCG5549140.1 transporter substrate-binding domain-containing protein [Halorhodospira halochloris]